MRNRKRRGEERERKDSVWGLRSDCVGVQKSRITKKDVGTALRCSSLPMEILMRNDPAGISSTNLFAQKCGMCS